MVKHRFEITISFTSRSKLTKIQGIKLAAKIANQTLTKKEVLDLRIDDVEFKINGENSGVRVAAFDPESGYEGFNDRYVPEPARERVMQPRLKIAPAEGSFCQYCGAHRGPDMKFCANCGKEF